MQIIGMAGSQNVNYRFNNDMKGNGSEYTCLREYQFPACSEELSRSGITCDAQRTLSKTDLREFDGTRVSVRIARDLAQDQVTPAGISENHGRARFRQGKVGEGKRNDDYRSG